LATLTTLTPLGVLFGVLVTYAIWAGIGGAVVRPFGSWWEALLLTGALLALIVVAWTIAMVFASTVQQPQPGDDDGAAVGLFLTLVFVFPPTLFAVALGKLIRRRLPF
jgi:hypothetical protein